MILLLVMKKRRSSFGGDMLKKKGKTLSTAESCTGGKIAAVLTSIPRF
jgi:nicotinamide mononucleotide (NMN) deamidase PncC